MDNAIIIENITTLTDEYLQNIKQLQSQFKHSKSIPDNIAHRHIKELVNHIDDINDSWNMIKQNLIPLYSQDTHTKE